jgi:hypothetical protein
LKPLDAQKPATDTNFVEDFAKQLEQDDNSGKAYQILMEDWIIAIKSLGLSDGAQIDYSPKRALNSVFFVISHVHLFLINLSLVESYHELRREHHIWA